MFPLLRTDSDWSDKVSGRLAAGWSTEGAAGFGKEATQERSIAAGWAAADGQIAILFPPHHPQPASLSSTLNQTKMHRTIKLSGGSGQYKSTDVAFTLIPVELHFN